MAWRFVGSICWPGQTKTGVCKSSMSDAKRERRRHEITELCLSDIFSRSRIQELAESTGWGKNLVQFVYNRRKGRSEGGSEDEEVFDAIYREDPLERRLKELRAALQDSSASERADLRRSIYAKTDYIPNYNPVVTKGLFGLVQLMARKHVFQKIKLSGHCQETLELAKRGGLIVLPTHNDMFDTLLAASPFLRAGLKPPVYQMGDNLRNGLNTGLLPMFNGMFIKRHGHSGLDTLVYANQVEVLLKEGENMVVYPEGRRSRDGKVAPLEGKERAFFGRTLTVPGMKRGFLGPILRANRNMDKTLSMVTMTVSAPVFSDIMRDYRREIRGQKSAINTFSRLFFGYRTFRHVSRDTGIAIHFGKPQPMGKGALSANTRLNRWRTIRSVREELKSSITVLPENLLAYILRSILLSNRRYQEASRAERLEALTGLFQTHRLHVQKKAVQRAEILDRNPDRAFSIALEFYRGHGILDSGLAISNHLLLEYNANRVQHFFKDALPLPG